MLKQSMKIIIMYAEVYFVDNMTPPIIKAVPSAIVRVKGSLRIAVEAIIVTSGTR